jgi:DNA-binding PadR family transcriptional regulator
MSGSRIEQENLKDIHDKIEEIKGLNSLKMWILHVLEHGPKNGVEIMDAVEEHHKAFYYHMKENMLPPGHGNEHENVKYKFKRPLPGSVYPMLKKMVNENLIIKQHDGIYKITEDGLEIVYKLFGLSKGTNDKTKREKAVQYALSEISVFVLYLEDIPKEELFCHEDLITNLVGRLKKIQDSIENR